MSTAFESVGGRSGVCRYTAEVHCPKTEFLLSIVIALRLQAIHVGLVVEQLDPEVWDNKPAILGSYEMSAILLTWRA